MALTVWPVYLLAVIGVLIGKRLVYKVTPKGSAQSQKVSLSMFIPHLVLGTITTVGIIVSFVTNNQAPQLIFFAFLNSFLMYTIVLYVVKERIVQAINEIARYKILATPLRGIARTIQMMFFA